MGLHVPQTGPITSTAKDPGQDLRQERATPTQPHTEETTLVCSAVLDMAETPIQGTAPEGGFKTRARLGLGTHTTSQAVLSHSLPPGIAALQQQKQTSHAAVPYDSHPRTGLLHADTERMVLP
jgi:hypothetical protein